MGDSSFIAFLCYDIGTQSVCLCVCVSVRACSMWYVVCVCICLDVCVCTCIRMVRVCARLSVCLCVHLCVCEVYLGLGLCVCSYMLLYVCMRVCLYCLCVCLCVCVYAWVRGWVCFGLMGSENWQKVEWNGNCPLMVHLQTWECPATCVCSLFGQRLCLLLMVSFLGNTEGWNSCPSV